MHQKTNKIQTVVNKSKKRQIEARRVDPNTFPIQNLSADLVQEYEAVWDDRELRRDIENRVGHYLRIRPSLIEHHEAG